MVFKRRPAAAKTRRRPKGANRLPSVTEGVARDTGIAAMRRRKARSPYPGFVPGPARQRLSAPAGARAEPIHPVHGLARAMLHRCPERGLPDDPRLDETGHASGETGATRSALARRARGATA
jgi:hypothetical protein